jgi:hypothetical protein
MNLAQALGVAAAALVMGLSAGGASPSESILRIAAEARDRLRPPALSAIVEDFVTLDAREHAPDPQHLAALVEGELNAIDCNAPPRAMSNDGFVASHRQALRAPPDSEMSKNALLLASLDS